MVAKTRMEANANRIKTRSELDDPSAHPPIQVPRADEYYAVFNC